MRKLRIALLGALLTLGTLAGAAAPAHGAILATEVCVTIYESTNTSDDHWTVCALPGSAKNASLVGDKTGLSASGCQGGGGNVPDWNDCVSMWKYSGLPANYRVVMYDAANYNYNLPLLPQCRDTNGSIAPVNLSGQLLNDNITSWRVEGGNC
jgi:hypothetical protein